MNLAALGVKVGVAAGQLYACGRVLGDGCRVAVGVAHKILVGPFAGT